MELVTAIVFINLALIFYTIGVWSEKIQKGLKKHHVIIFWIGIVCDTLGTTAMQRISNGSMFSFHGITGLLALILMLVHAIWATVVLIRKDPKAIETFHRFSILVWIIWLIPFISGAMMHMI